MTCEEMFDAIINETIAIIDVNRKASNNVIVGEDIIHALQDNRNSFIDKCHEQSEIGSLFIGATR